MKIDDLQLTKYNFHPSWWLKQPFHLHGALLKIGLSYRHFAPQTTRGPCPNSAPSSNTSGHLRV
ncbi:hypothetical protein ColLi_12739 [Colletotrichum liriopes]|uniref:Uncharacterized protein n=1 Tax=Colletotrichum liriopes TaxID=708192 RepID=A0AA37H0T7_9PEZI|nr:hypothetical protein ColLi_12739 [Colletotrichum liriopes]